MIVVSKFVGLLVWLLPLAHTLSHRMHNVTTHVFTYARALLHHAPTTRGGGATALGTALRKVRRKTLDPLVGWRENTVETLMYILTDGCPSDRTFSLANIATFSRADFKAVKTRSRVCAFENFVCFAYHHSHFLMHRLSSYN